MLAKEILELVNLVKKRWVTRSRGKDAEDLAISAPAVHRWGQEMSPCVRCDVNSIKKLHYFVVDNNANPPCSNVRTSGLEYAGVGSIVGAVRKMY